MRKAVLTTSWEQTQKLGEELAHPLKGGGIVALHGDLGSGKTTFVQGLARGLGITKKIISPTFIIMRTYEVEGKRERGEGKGFRNFYHVDLYRIHDEKDVEGVGLFEIIKDPENIVVIEWPDKIEHLMPEKRIDIFFEYLDENKRQIRIKS